MRSTAHGSRNDSARIKGSEPQESGSTTVTLNQTCECRDREKSENRTRGNRLFFKTDDGDPTAAEQLLPLVYEELRRLAKARLSKEQPGQTLQPTALVHEAYTRLVGNDVEQHWNGRGHFFGAAAEAMRRILVDNARRKKAAKRGGDRERVPLDDQFETPKKSVDLVALDKALDQLAVKDPRKAELVKLRLFRWPDDQPGRPGSEIADSTADADWAYAKAWLRVQLNR